MSAKDADPAIAEHVKTILADAPPLNDETRNRIAALLRVGGGVR